MIKHLDVVRFIIFHSQSTTCVLYVVIYYRYYIYYLLLVRKTKRIHGARVMVVGNSRDDDRVRVGYVVSFGARRFLISKI